MARWWGTAHRPPACEGGTKRSAVVPPRLTPATGQHFTDHGCHPRREHVVVEVLPGQGDALRPVGEVGAGGEQLDHPVRQPGWVVWVGIRRGTRPASRAARRGPLRRPGWPARTARPPGTAATSRWSGRSRSRRSSVSRGRCRTGGATRVARRTAPGRQTRPGPRSRTPCIAGGGLRSRNRHRS